MATTTSSVTSSSAAAVNSPSPLRGTRPSDFGILNEASPPPDSLDTSTTYSPSLSPPTTDKSSPPVETRPSNSGTPWVNSNGVKKARTVTPSGFPPSNSPQPPRTQSSFPAHGTKP